MSRSASGHGGWCRARSNSSWLHALSRHLVGLSWTAALVPFALAHDRRSFFAAVHSRRFSGVAEIDARTNAVKHIKAFPGPAEDQADGAFDGRWLVWSEYHSLTSPGDFTVWAWDSRSGQVTKIGAARRSPGREFWESPLQAPAALDGVATWVQGTGPGGIAAVHVYDLRTGHGTIIRRGHAQGSFLFARRLVGWPESPGPGRVTRMRVASAVTGRSGKVPRALRVLEGVSGLATDGHRIAYPNAPYRSLWWSPSLHRRPSKIVTAPSQDHIDDSVQVAGRYIGFGIWPRLFVADTKTHRYVQVARHGGWIDLDRTTLLVASGSRAKAIHPHLRIALVPLGKLPPIPACT
ncbi:MAG: hypothetical protein ACXVRJ_05195 [Gaiellaceae bacterium]